MHWGSSWVFCNKVCTAKSHQVPLALSHSACLRETQEEADESPCTAPKRSLQETSNGQGTLQKTRHS